MKDREMLVLKDNWIKLLTRSRLTSEGEHQFCIYKLGWKMLYNQKINIPGFVQ